MSFWTPERKVQLAELWAAGITTREIGRRMGCTKNSALGKAHRLMLSPRPSPLPRKPRSAAKHKSKPPPKLIDVGGRPCSWPIGHPGEAGFRFCDEPAIEGKSYCAPHYRKAHIRRSAVSDG